MGFLDRFRKQNIQFVATPLTERIESEIVNRITMSTPFRKWYGSLSIPQILPQTNGMVHFGVGNTYPQILTQLYYYSGTHSASIDFITDSIIGSGYKVKQDYTNNTLKGMFEMFERKNKLQRTLNYLVKDYVIHRRMYILVDKSSVIPTFKRLDASYCLVDKELTTVYYSTDWQRRTDYREYSTNPLLDRYVIIYHDHTPGQDVYPIPSYNAVLDYIYLQRDIASYQKAHIQNTVFANLVIAFPTKPANDEQWADLQATIEGFKGAEGDRIIALFGNGVDDIPIITPIQTATNDSTFQQLAESTDKAIMQAHRIVPALLGISEAGQLGDNQQIKNHFSIFKKLVADSMRGELQDHFNDALKTLGFAPIEIIDFKLIDDEGVIEQ